MDTHVFVQLGVQLFVRKYGVSIIILLEKQVTLILFFPSFQE